MRFLAMVIASTAMTVSLVACGGTAAANTQAGAELMDENNDIAEIEVTPQAMGDPERGRDIFETGAGIYPSDNSLCIKCHSLDASGKYGPSLKGISKVASERVPGLSAEEYLRQSILEPDAFIAGDYPEKMGSIHAAILSEKDVDDLVAFLLTQ